MANSNNGHEGLMPFRVPESLISNVLPSPTLRSHLDHSSPESPLATKRPAEETHQWSRRLWDRSKRTRTSSSGPDKHTCDAAFIDEERRNSKENSRQRDLKNLAEKLSVSEPIEPDNRPGQYRRYVPGLPSLLRHVEAGYTCAPSRYENYDAGDVSEFVGRIDNNGEKDAVNRISRDNKEGGDDEISLFIEYDDRVTVGDGTDGDDEAEDGDKDGQPHFEMPHINIALPENHLTVSELKVKISELLEAPPENLYLVDAIGENGSSVRFKDVLQYIQRRCEPADDDELVIISRKAFKLHSDELQNHIHRKCSKAYEEYYGNKATETIPKLKDKIQRARDKITKLKTQNKHLKAVQVSRNQPSPVRNHINQQHSRTFKSKGNRNSDPGTFDDPSLGQVPGDSLDISSKWTYPKISEDAVAEFEARNPYAVDPNFIPTILENSATPKGMKMDGQRRNNAYTRPRDWQVRGKRPQTLQPDENGVYGQIVGHDAAGPVYEYGNFTPNQPDLSGSSSGPSHTSCPK